LLLAGDLQQAQSSLATLLQSDNKVELAEVQSGQTVTVVVPARLPTQPIGPHTARNALLAAVVGAMTVAGLAFLVESQDDTLKSAEDVGRALRLATLGGLGRIPGKTMEERIVTVAQPKSPVAEGFRVLRTNLQFSAPDKPLCTLLVTSPQPTEGKSTTAANLAVVMAQAGKKVILVDADLRRPVLHRLFGVDNRSGLSDVLLVGAGGLDGHLKRIGSGIEELYLLSAGPLPPNPAELLGSRRMEALVQRLRFEADVIVFDSPPSLAVADAAVLASQTDGVLVVADAGRTRTGLAQQGVERLHQVGANVLGVALNRVGAGRDGEDAYYHHYYYHRYCGNGNNGRQGWLARRLPRRSGYLRPPGDRQDEPGLRLWDVVSK
jgi:succinoglycan biosynthesis transport protein ExoP